MTTLHEYKRAYYLAHREELLAKAKAYYQNNKRKCNLRSADYYAKHREELKAKQWKRYREMKQSHGESTN